jgi:hypothetical protein
VRLNSYTRLALASRAGSSASCSPSGRWSATGLPTARFCSFCRVSRRLAVSAAASLRALLWRSPAQRVVDRGARVSARKRENPTTSRISCNAGYHSVQTILPSRLLSKNVKIRIYKIINSLVILYRCEVSDFKGGT